MGNDITANIKIYRGVLIDYPAILVVELRVQDGLSSSAGIDNPSRTEATGSYLEKNAAMNASTDGSYSAGSAIV